MFDFGFTELMLVAVVALIVVGPQRLPKVARTAGHLLGRVQRYVSEVKSDISREMQLDELKKLQKQVQEEARDLETSVRKEMGGVESAVRESAQVIERDLAPPSETAGPGDTARSGNMADAAPPELARAASEGVIESTPADPATSSAAESDGSPRPQLELGLDEERASRTEDRR